MESSMSEVQLEVRDGIAVVTLHRPPVNALNTTFLNALEETLAQLEEEETARAVVLTGAGRSFSAGLDLKEVPGYSVAEQRTLIQALSTALGRLYGFPRPTVAAINGHAIAGGLILALATDRRLAISGTPQEIQLGLTEVRVGIPFPAAPLAVVRGELTPAAARRLILGAKLYGADEAMALGVVDTLVPPAELLDRAFATARQLAELPSATYARVKGQLRRATLEQIEKAHAQDPLLDDWLE
jgi:enoyl-CoA hydratase